MSPVKIDKSLKKGRCGIGVIFYISLELDNFIESVRAGRSRSAWLRDLVAEKYPKSALPKMLEVGRRPTDKRR